MANFKERYNKIRTELKQEMGVSSVEAVPRLKQVSVSIGAGEAVKDSNFLETASQALATITGQKPVVRKARKSIAGFKLREGMPIGLLVTLRGKRMYDFLDKLINVALPRVRDFQGVSIKSFDGYGNYTIGIKEHVVFPEVELDNVEKTLGLAITINTTAVNDEDARKLLEKLNVPFKEKEK